MQILSRPIRWNRRGYALLIVMCFLAACLLIFASMMCWISGNANITAMNNQFNMSEAAAESATEKVLTTMNYAYIGGSLTNNGNYYSPFIPTSYNQTNWPIQYIYSATNGQQNQISVNMGVWTTNTQPLNSQYAGLYGLVMPCTITATATPIGQQFSVPATVCESFQFASIPLFQFAIFYNMNLEICAAQTLTVAGPVWSNGGFWSGSTTVTFSSYVSAVGIATNTASDPFCSYTGSGASTFSMAGQPTSGNDRITMPIGTNNDPAAVEAIINIPPPAYAMGTAPAYTTNGMIYFANGCDLYLTNWGVNSLKPTGTNMLLYYQDGLNTFSYQTLLPYDFYIITNRGGSPTTLGTNYVTATNSPNNITNIIYAGYSFVTNVLFYDWREGWNNGNGINNKGKAVQAVQIDVASFNAWLYGTNMYGGTNRNGGQTYNAQCASISHKNHPIDSIYIYNAVPLTSATLPAVRVANGGMLPSHSSPYGFTVATAQPLYVYGDYNVSNNLDSSIDLNSTTYTWPAGLMGDAITILSAAWKDSTTSKKPAPSATTTVNAAVLAGIVQSTNSTYSGGVENFFRLLESGGTFYWNGAIIVMFPSQYGTNCWLQTGNYYDAPTRKWGFDTNFMQQGGLPPRTPQARGVIRATWNAY